MTDRVSAPAEGSGLAVHDLTVAGPAGTIVARTSFVIPPGDTLAVVGESGSGKSMTARALVGLLPPGVTATGTVQAAGADFALPLPERAWRRVRGRISLLPQDPFTSLSPVHICGNQIAWTMRARGLSRRATAARVAELLDEVHLPARVARQYPHELSGGMRQRVALACAIAPDPAVLLADEPTTALDASNRGGMLDLITRIQVEHDTSLLLVSHDLGLVAGYAERVLVMYAGRVVESGPTDEVLPRPRHPYSAALRDADPPFDTRLDRLVALPGNVPKPGQAPGGCVFHDRCPLAVADCSTTAPAPRVNGPVEYSCLVSTGPLAANRARHLVADARVSAGPGLLRVTSMTKRFGATTALDDVSVTVQSGECVGVLGESGSGKTTLARCVAGLEQADAGSVKLRGTELVPGARTPRQVQVVFQDPYSALNPSFRVARTLAEAARAHPAAGRPTVERLLDLVGLPAEYARKRPMALSGGERQRVVLARALAPGPELLICDESVSALDVTVQAQILNLLQDLRRELGLTVLFISHDLAVVRQVCERVYVMRHGRVLESGTTARVLDKPADDYTRLLVAASSDAARRVAR